MGVFKHFDNRSQHRYESVSKRISIGTVCTVFVAFFVRKCFWCGLLAAQNKKKLAVMAAEGNAQIVPTDWWFRIVVSLAARLFA